MGKKQCSENGGLGGRKAREHMEHEKNPVLDFQWASDIERAGVPQNYIPEWRTVEYLEDGTEQVIKRNGHRLIQADPNDYLELECGAAPKERYHAHAKMLRDTVDQYIYEYAYLMDMYSRKKNLDNWIEIEVPESFMTKFKNYGKKNAKGTSKPLAVRPEYLKEVKAEKSKVIMGDGYITPQIGKGIYLHQLCRSLYTSTTASKKLNSLLYDGLKFRAKNEPDFIPNFELEEYWLHEHNTGICLSIEITAILLEVTQEYQNQEMWDHAFEVFCEMVLPILVRSPYLFARNAVARYFFQQILMDCIVKSYQWIDEEHKAKQLKIDQAEQIEYAAYHSRLLSTMPYLIEMPEEQLEDAIAHVWKLICAIKAPVNIAEYIKSPTYGLALFCNRNHKNVSFFLDELEKHSIGEGAANLKKDRHRGKNHNPYIVFEKVRTEVKAAIHKANSPLPKDTANKDQ